MNQQHDKNADMYEQRPLKRRIFSLPSLLLFVIFAAFVYFLLTQFPTDWSATFDTIAHMNPWYYLLAFALYYATFILRGQRWRMLAQNTGDLDDIPHGRLPTIRESSTYILIGWFVNSITWLRMGDGYRAWLFARGSGGSFSWSLGTVLAERVLDVVSMLLILLASALFLLFSARSISDAAVFVIPGTSFVIPSHIVVILGIFVVVVLSLCVLVAMKLWGPRFARFLPSRLEDEFHRFQSGTLGSMKQMPTVIALGGGAWVLEVARLYFVAQALGLEVPLALIAIAALSAAILSTVPIPGGVGFVESGIIGVLLLALGRPEAVSIALVDRSITFVSVIVIGGVVFLISQVWGQRQSSPEYT
ncbi:MAG: lysylphosphatidylglycerol synthase transmembrane domain-containing protein [Chloroflexota bacterium]|nr:lysylphosphatidylglycerol synthase transmembrane domain-containing protein [Chloroflexota bacterium]